MKKKENNNSEYLDPRWQKKRLEVMEKTGFKCQCCGSKDNTLHVHHLDYEHGKNVWDYSSSELECLCEECHRKKHLICHRIKLCMENIDAHLLSCLSGVADGLFELSKTSNRFEQAVEHLHTVVELFVDCAGAESLLEQVNHGLMEKGE